MVGSRWTIAPWGMLIMLSLDEVVEIKRSLAPFHSLVPQLCETGKIVKYYCCTYTKLHVFA